MSVKVEVPIWEDETLADVDEAFWAGLVNLVAERNAEVLARRRERGEDLSKHVYSEKGRPLLRWVCDAKQTVLKGIEAVIRDKEGCCSDLAALRAGECMAEGEVGVEVALEDRTGKGRPYHAIVLINGVPEEPDVSEFFGMGASK